MIKLTLIIPTLNAAQDLEPCLQAIGTAGELAAEVVISDGGSTDDTIAVALSYGANIVLGPPGRGGQLRRAAAQAGGDWFLFLHADTILPPDWAHICAGFIACPSQPAAAFRLQFRASGLPARIVAGWANLRSRLGLPYGDQALLISAAEYARVGGYPDQPLMEDVEIAKRLAGNIQLLPATVTTGAQKYQAQGWLRRGARNLGLLIRYKLGADPAKLARAYCAPSAASDENCN